jgi:hypothetical protein
MAAMTRPFEEVYLGDGLYVSLEAYAIKLRAPRQGGDHEVYLEPEMLDALIEFAKSIGWIEPPP